MKEMAEESDGRAMTEMARLRCSMEYDSSVEERTCVERLEGGFGREASAERVESSQRRTTLVASSTCATAGQTVFSKLSCTMRISAALHAAG